MTAKVIPNDSFRAACFYVCRESKDAQVLAAEGVRTDSAAHMAEDFTFQRQLQPDLGMAVLHVAISLRPADATGRSPEEVSQLLERAARGYLKELADEMKSEPLATQWLLVQHFDKGHPHAHLLVNRVNNQGEIIPDAFIGQYSRRACQQVEGQLGLVTAEEEGRAQAQQPGPTNRQATATTPREERRANWQRARHTVASALIADADTSSGFEDLEAKLAPQRIQQVVSEHAQPDGSVHYGVRYTYNGYSFKGGEVGQAFTAPQLQAGFERHRQAQVTAAVNEFTNLFETGRLNALLQEGEARAASRAGAPAQAAEQEATPPQRVPQVARSLPAADKADELEL